MVLTIIIVSMVPMIVVSSTLYLQFRHSYREKVNDHLTRTGPETQTEHRQFPAGALDRHPPDGRPQRL
ncbi:MAG: hypothetical protein MZV70_16135 [Desulfobacterales bacterium]|nr:hypothetical protein [Desulfobacterales bacterium]